MPVKRLDETAQRLITEELIREDLGGEVARLAAIVEALRRPAHSWELRMEKQTVAAMAVAVESSSTNGRVVRLPDVGRSPMSRARRVKVGLLAVAGVLALGAGLAVAGHLPEEAQEAVANAAERVGVQGFIPHPETGPPDGPAILQQEGVGEDVSEAATDDETSGTDKVNAVLDATGQSVPDSVPAGDENGNNAEISGGANGAARSEAGSEAANQGAENADRRGSPSSD